MIHFPLTYSSCPSPSGYSWKLICIPQTYAVIKSPAGDEGAESRDESLKIRKCHQLHRGDVSQGTLTGRQLNWLWRLLYHVQVHFTAQCHGTQRYSHLKRLDTTKTRNLCNYFILGAINFLFLGLTDTVMKEIGLWNHNIKKRYCVWQHAIVQIHLEYQGEKSAMLVFSSLCTFPLIIPRFEGHL